MKEINESVLVYINSFLEHDIMQNFVKIFADGPIFFLPLFLVGAWLFYSFSKKYKNAQVEVRNYKKDLLFIFYAAALAITFNIIFQQFFHFDRPDEICKQTGQLILNKIPEASFPSDHAAVSVAFLTALFFTGYVQTGLFFSIFVIGMNLARVMACVHWPFDILAGSVVGIIVTIITFTILKKRAFIDAMNNWILKLMEKCKL